MMPASLYSNSMSPSWSSRRDQDLQQLRDKLAQSNEAAAAKADGSKGVQASSDAAQPEASASAVAQKHADTNRVGERDNSAQQTPPGQETAEEEKQRLEQEVAKLELEQARALDEMRQRDQEVRTHERAHASTGGQWAGAPSYETETGPDGRQYAVSGEVKIDTAPIADDPEATIDKMRVVMAAAMAPAEPSAQDRSVYAQAQATLAEAQMALAQQRNVNHDSTLRRVNADDAPSMTRDDPALSNNNETIHMPDMAQRREPVTFAFGRPRNLNVAVAQGRQFFGETASSAGQAVAFYFDWAATNRWDYTPGGRLNIAA